MADYLFFDLDGTLTDPSLGITNSIMHALRVMGREVPPREALYRFIGPPLIPAFQEFLGMTEEESREALLHYREYFSVKGLFENVPYEGIEAALTELRGMGKVLCVATSKPEEFARRILEHFALDGYFTMICGATMDERRTEKAEVLTYLLEQLSLTSGIPAELIAANAVMIGDRSHDILGAKAAGLPGVGVLWGFGSAEELRESGASMLIPTVYELSAALDVSF